MTDRTKSDAYLRAIGPRPLTPEEHDRYIELCIEEGSIDTGEGIQDKLLVMLEEKRRRAAQSQLEKQPDSSDSIVSSKPE